MPPIGIYTLSRPGLLPDLLWRLANRQHPLCLLGWGDGVYLTLVEREPGILEPDYPLHAVEQQIANMTISSRHVVECAGDGGTTRRSRRVLLDGGPKLQAERQQALKVGAGDDVLHVIPPLHKATMFLLVPLALEIRIRLD